VIAHHSALSTDIEQRVAMPEENNRVLREIIAAVTGRQQALLCGLQALITESHPAVRAAAMQRALDGRGDLLQALPVADALLDQTEAARHGARPPPGVYRRAVAMV
jgi:hypothetical protein